MNDTDTKTAQKVKELLKAKTAQERFKMGFSTMAMARSLVTHSIKSAEPGISEKIIRRRVFLRYYAKDFSSEECAKIMEGLETKGDVFAGAEKKAEEIRR